MKVPVIVEKTYRLEVNNTTFTYDNKKQTYGLATRAGGSITGLVPADIKQLRNFILEVEALENV
jgi:hypothetical protein